MICASGSPTLFLTFSCEEYESADIDRYLRKVNNVSLSYNIGKLCTEDPISVSRKFSLKFHAFFCTDLLKGAVLGQVDYFYWKKNNKPAGLLITTCFCGYGMHRLLDTRCTNVVRIANGDANAVAPSLPGASLAFPAKPAKLLL